MKKIVTFDFDRTLSRKDVQDYACSLLSKGIEIWVLTSRYDDLHRHKYLHKGTNDDIYSVVDELGIPRDKIRFTCMRHKYEYLEGTNVILHLDDDYIELNMINKFTSTKGISVINSSYKQKCNKLLFKK
jgi:uncharacterized HAD superfamily protein